MSVYVFGLGHVGLPMACFAAIAGKKVIGIDTNPNVIKEILFGEVKIYEYYDQIHISDLAKDLIAKDKLVVKHQFNRVEDNPGIFIISVGIKSDENFAQDTSPIEEVINTILPALIEDDLIVFRTTLIPGTIDNLVRPKIEKLPFNVHLAYCPETISETHAFTELKNNPLVIGAKDDQSFNKAKDFFASLSDAPIYRASSIKTAELIKVVQNISRDVDIALVNELSEATNKLGIDINEVSKLASTHPRVKLMQPGPGVGGYCLPNALIYLKLALEGDSDNTLKLMNTAREINKDRPKKVVQRIEASLEAEGKSLVESTVAVIGLAMKDNCADFRYSPAVDIVNLLLEKGAKIRAYDPVVTKLFPFQKESFRDTIFNADCLVITAIQPGITFNPDLISELMQDPAIILDTRNIFSDSDKVKLYRV